MLRRSKCIFVVSAAHQPWILLATDNQLHLAQFRMLRIRLHPVSDDCSRTGMGHSLGAHAAIDRARAGGLEPGKFEAAHMYESSRALTLAWRSVIINRKASL